MPAVLLLLLIAPSQAHAQYQGCTLITQISLDECKTLEKLFTETGGSQWFYRRGWLRSNQPCEWYGITCASGGWPRSITRIELPGNNLTGSLPGDLSLLTELRVLNVDNRGAGIRYRKLHGTLPAVLGQLEHLEVLRLDNNEFTGTVPVELGKLSNLRMLGLSQNLLTGPIPGTLGSLQDLVALDLSQNQFSGTIPDSLLMLHSLELLSLSDNLLEGTVPNSLGTLTKLRALNFSNNNLHGSLPDSLAALGQLHWLSVADNDLSGPVPLTIAAFGAGITTCQMERNRLCLPDDPPYEALGAETICGLPPSTSCRVCEGDACTALEALFYHTDGAAWLRSSGWLASSSPCGWYGTRCDDHRITGLTLPSNGLRGTLPAELNSLVAMAELDLADNALHGEIPSELGELASLSRLNMSGNTLTGPVPLSVATLGANMESCDLSRNAGLCIPDGPEYRALDKNPICGLPLVTSCVPSRLVTVTKFEAEAKYDGILLYWQTDTTATNVTFEIEQQYEEGTFLRIGKISSRQLTFQYSVNDLPAGKYTFRLKQVAGPGDFSYSEPATVTLVPKGLTIGTPFPTPFAAYSVLPFTSGTQQQIRAVLFDASGRLVRVLYDHTPPAHQTVKLQVDGSGLSNGVFFVRFETDGQVLGVRTLVHVR